MRLSLVFLLSFFFISRFKRKVDEKKPKRQTFAFCILNEEIDYAYTVYYGFPEHIISVRGAFGTQNIKCVCAYFFCSYAAFAVIL